MAQWQNDCVALARPWVQSLNNYRNVNQYKTSLKKIKKGSERQKHFALSLLFTGQNVIVSKLERPQSNLSPLPFHRWRP